MSKVPAKKETEGKLDLSLVPLGAVESIARALEHGSKKYGRDNYRKGHKESDLLAATLRHLFKYCSGEERDAESGLSHLDHAASNLAMLSEQARIGSLRK